MHICNISVSLYVKCISSNDAMFTIGPTHRLTPDRRPLTVEDGPSPVTITDSSDNGSRGVFIIFQAEATY